jgi:uncharacterized protein (DUF433 family)
MAYAAAKPGSRYRQYRGAFVVKGTRVPVSAVLDNAEDGDTAEQIAAEIYHGLPVEPTRRVIEFARRASFATPAA